VGERKKSKNFVVVFFTKGGGARATKRQSLEMSWRADRSQELPRGSRRERGLTDKSNAEKTTVELMLVFTAPIYMGQATTANGAVIDFQADCNNPMHAKRVEPIQQTNTLNPKP
jgi:hypothetical protein